MPKQLYALTEKQMACFPGWVDKWVKVGLSTERTDWNTVEKAVKACYALIGRDPPKVILRVESPMASYLTGAFAVQGLTGSQTELKVELQVKKQVKEQVEEQLVEKVREQIWLQAGERIADQVGENVESPVWMWVWQRAGSLVGSQIREQLVEKVREQIGLQAWSQGQYSQENYRSGQFWSSWFAYISFLRDICNWENDSLNNFALDEQLQSAGSIWWHELVCAISDRPVFIGKNNAGLHADGRMAIEYSDGWGFYALNGVIVPEWLVMLKPHQLDPRKLTELTDNTEVRREFVRKIGVERCLKELNWKAIESTEIYELGELSVVGTSRRYLKMLNPSIKVWHLEAVHPTCNTIQEAINWRRYGDKKKIWQPHELT